ncbi:SRPBCC domain-containing protein [Thalassospiraceae bacterium LMO-SO8]|nr:SRPBCC domain-containing protein [Alphaproteobacteria bacterium LMO-S08]WND74383.1 SRPBCC domain-containing protein [Thalassospiraceae bacterium LMO-SO8]
MDTAAQPDLDQPQTTLFLTRTFAAPRALLFKLWTQPEHIVRWWGCAETGSVDFTSDLRVGGEFTAVMQLANGHTHRITGVYCKIEEPARLVFTWAWENTDGFQGGETLVTVTFEEKDGQTELTLRHESFATEDACAAHGQGWGASLDRLGEIIATL